jgi:hypothetical protein
VGVVASDAHTPAVEVPSATETVVSTSKPPALLTITLTAEEVAIISSGLRMMNKVTLDSYILAAFNTLAAVLERSALG